MKLFFKNFKPTSLSCQRYIVKLTSYEQRPDAINNAGNIFDKSITSFLCQKPQQTVENMS